MSKFSVRLKELRHREGLSQQALADMLGISKSSINMYERGEREPGLETLESIADYFNVDMNYLLGQSNDPINYENPDLIASIPLSYMEACGGDVKKAWATMEAADSDAREELIRLQRENNVLKEKADAQRELSNELGKIITEIATTTGVTLDAENKDELQKYTNYFKALVGQMDSEEKELFKRRIMKIFEEHDDLLTSAYANYEDLKRK